MAENGDAITAGDVRRGAAFVAFVVGGDDDCTVLVAAEAQAAGRLRQLGLILDALWLGAVADEPPAVRAVMLDPQHLRAVAARLALAEDRGQALPPMGWLRPAA